MPPRLTAADLTRWRADPVAFVTEVLRDPETGKPFVLYPAQEQFLRLAFTLTPDGRLPFAELLFSAPKKSGKTATAAMALLYAVVVLGGPYAEGYCCANDLEQSQGRVFQAATRIVAASPLLAKTARVTERRIEFRGSGATITALAQDYAGAAGSNPTLTVFDELWAYTSERSRRLWDEQVPPPTRRVAARLTVTYAGFEGESTLLEDLRRRGLALDEHGTPTAEALVPDLYRVPGMLTYWTHDPPAPWQTPAWLEEMQRTLRPAAFLRLIRNLFVTTESPFLDPAWWTACEQLDPAAHPLAASPSLPVVVGVDASHKRDSTAVVVVTWDATAERVRLVWHRIWQPTRAEPLDFDATIGATLRALRGRFALDAVLFDPWQMQALAQTLTAEGLPMREFPQTVANLTAAASNLFELVKGANLVAYPDEALRAQVRHAIAVETSRGWRIAKEKATHKVDAVVALAMAALVAVQERPGVLEVPAFGNLSRERREPIRWDDGLP